MTTMQDIEQATEVYAEARQQVQDLLAALRETIRQHTQAELPGIRAAADEAGNRLADLEALIEGAPDLFKKPRSKKFHGIKVGYRKQKGKVTFVDEQKTIALIRKQLPSDQVELLINVKESVAKSAVDDLSAADLKRLGITVEADTDEVQIKAEGSDLEKMVAELIGEFEKESTQAA